MKTMRTWAVPGLILLAGTTLAACGDTEPAASPSPTEDTMMEDESMTEESMEKEDDSMEDDAMEDEG